MQKPSIVENGVSAEQIEAFKVQVEALPPHKVPGFLDSFHTRILRTGFSVNAKPMSVASIIREQDCRLDEANSSKFHAIDHGYCGLSSTQEYDAVARGGMSYSDYYRKQRIDILMQGRDELRLQAPEGTDSEQYIQEILESDRTIVHDKLVRFITDLRAGRIDNMTWQCRPVVNFLFNRGYRPDNFYRTYLPYASCKLTPDEEIAIAEQVLKETGLTLEEAEILEQVDVPKKNA